MLKSINFCLFHGARIWICIRGIRSNGKIINFWQSYLLMDTGPYRECGVSDRRANSVRIRIAKSVRIRIGEPNQCEFGTESQFSAVPVPKHLPVVLVIYFHILTVASLCSVCIVSVSVTSFLTYNVKSLSYDFYLWT
jgi:hypothetical protein